MLAGKARPMLMQSAESAAAVRAQVQQLCSARPAAAARAAALRLGGVAQPALAPQVDTTGRGLALQQTAAAGAAALMLLLVGVGQRLAWLGAGLRLPAQAEVGRGLRLAKAQPHQLGLKKRVLTLPSPLKLPHAQPSLT